jgi:hypothetical protein
VIVIPAVMIDATAMSVRLSMGVPLVLLMRWSWSGFGCRSR